MTNNKFTISLSVLIIGVLIGLSSLLQLPLIAVLSVIIFVFILALPLLGFRRFNKLSIISLLFFSLFQDLIYFRTGFEPVKSIDEILILFLFLFNIKKIIVSFKNRKNIKLLFPIIILLFSGIISSLINEVPINIWIQGAFIFLKGYLLLLVSLVNGFEKKDFDWLVKVTITIGILSAFAGIIDLLFPVPFREIVHGNSIITYRGKWVEIKGFFTHSYFFAWFQAITLIFLLKSRKLTYSRIFSILLILFSLLISLKRKELIAIVLIIGVFVFFSKQISKPKKLTILTTFTIVLISFSPMLIESFTQFNTKFVLQENDLEPRVILYDVAYQIAHEKFPLGVGFGRYGSWTSVKYLSPVYSEYGMEKAFFFGDKVLFVDDTYWAAVIGETGYLGTFGNILFLLIITIRVIKSKNRLKWYALNFIILYTIQSIGAPVFFQPPQNVWFYWLIGQWLYLDTNKKTEDGNLECKTG